MTKKNKAMKKVKIAIVGFGGMGEWHYCRMQESGLFDVAGVYDISEKRRARARELGLTAWESPAFLQIEPGLQAALIATPNDLHLPYVEYLAPRGLNLICEKPATLTSGYFDIMNEVAKKSGVVLAVHQNRRWDPDFLTVKKIKEEGLVGEIYEIESAVTGSHGIPGEWRKEKARGGGMMLDWGVHLIDQLLQFDASKVVDVDCDMSYAGGFEVEDGFRLHLKFESGLKATVIVDTNCFINRPRWRVQGTLGTAVVENWECAGEIVRVKEREDRALSGMKAGNGYTRTMADRSRESVETLPLPQACAEPFAFYKNFVAALGGGTLAVKPEEVSRALKVMGISTLGRLPVSI